MDNATAKAVSEAFGFTNSCRKATHILPFSSAYKYTAVSFEDEAYMIGAPEFVLGSAFPSELAKADEYSSDGTRVLALCSAKFDGKYIEHIGGLMSRPPSCFGVEANCMAAVNTSLFS